MVSGGWSVAIFGLKIFIMSSSMYGWQLPSSASGSEVAASEAPEAPDDSDSDISAHWHSDSDAEAHDFEDREHAYDTMQSSDASTMLAELLLELKRKAILSSKQVCTVAFWAC